tara:strand:+ start:38271 stop:39125 length:855 start_codon:yes stop_codon:yes gene_type:complete
MIPIKNVLNNIASIANIDNTDEIKHSNHNLNQGNVFLTNKQHFKTRRLKPIIEGMGNFSETDAANLDTKINQLSALQNVLDNWDPEKKGKFKKKATNVKDKYGNIYYKNLDGDYYKYKNSAGYNTFKPNHINFDSSCPKTAPIFEKDVPYPVGNIDPISSSVLDDRKCIKFQDEELQDVYIQIITLEREIKELKEKQRNENIKDTSTIAYLKNLEAIKLSDKVNKYNELVEKSKKITDDINSFDTSRDEFMKSVGALQIQYGAIGITTIALIYLMVKMMSSKKE